MRGWAGSHGADYVFDYREPDVPERIREVSRDELTLVLDTISTPETAAFCGRAMSSVRGWGVYGFVARECGAAG